MILNYNYGFRIKQASSTTVPTSAFSPNCFVTVQAGQSDATLYVDESKAGLIDGNRCCYVIVREDDL